MREILFRGKNPDTGEWIYGYYAKHSPPPNDKVCHVVFGCCHIESVDNLTEYHWNLVNPETVGQFTGLTDKHGKKIFEEDVCRFYGTEGYSDYVVFWGDTVSQWTVRQIDLGAKDVLDNYFAECCEVIGNIHDNPELLGGEGNG